MIFNCKKLNEHKRLSSKICIFKIKKIVMGSDAKLSRVCHELFVANVSHECLPRADYDNLPWILPL